MTDAPGSQVPTAEAAPQEAAGDQQPTDALVTHPARLLRIGAMAKELLEETRRANLDEASRDRLRDIYQVSVRQLGELLAPELGDELRELSLPLGDGVPSEAELRVAQAQLVGWLEGLFHGIQATLFAQQMETQARLAEMRKRGLPHGTRPEEPAPGTYL